MQHSFQTCSHFFISPKFRGYSSWLPNLNRDCSPSRPSHTWTCHEFLWKQAGRRKGSECRSATAASLRLTWTLQLKPRDAAPRTHGIMQRQRHRARTGQWRRTSSKTYEHEDTPIDQWEACSRARVHRGTWLGAVVHVRAARELEHCCCVKWKGEHPNLFKEQSLKRTQNQIITKLTCQNDFQTLLNNKLVSIWVCKALFSAKS